MNPSQNNILVIIPARGGSKGLPNKNIKLLAGKPLIQYTIEVALSLFKPEQICVTTDSKEIVRVVQDLGLLVPFMRPSALATDSASSRDVVLHALEFYEREQNINYSSVILLQPTSPFRKVKHIQEALKLFTNGVELVVSVKAATANPYFTLFEENADGFLKKSKEHTATRRQDVPDVWEFNGALYIFDSEIMKAKPFTEFLKIRKYVMDEFSSVDIDTELDWVTAEYLVQKNK